jgi:hypothetical protein
MTMVGYMNDATVRGSQRPFLSAVKALDEERRDDALYLLAKQHRFAITQYVVCKTVVLADVFQVLEVGKTIFGGPLTALPFGPVESSTYDDVKRWAKAALATGMIATSPLQKSGSMPGRDHIYHFSAAPGYARGVEASWEYFSEAEEKNIRRAYKKVIGMTWRQSQRFFHEPISAIGYAYDVATKPYAKPFKSSVAMNWFDVLDGAEQIEKQDVNYARAALSLWI